MTNFANSRSIKVRFRHIFVQLIINLIHLKIFEFQVQPLREEQMSETGWSLDADPPESVTNEPINDRLGLDENSLISVASSVTSATNTPLQHSSSLNMATNKQSGVGGSSSSSGGLGIIKQNSLNTNDLNRDSSFSSSNLINFNTEQVTFFHL
jgi:hypothetical protein